MRVAAVQMEHAPADNTANLGKIRAFVSQAAERDVNIIVFPECCISGYWFLRGLSRDELLDLAEPIPDGASTREILALAVEYKLIVGAGLVEVDSDGALYNSYVVALPDGKWFRHRKLHCFVNVNMASGKDYTVFDTPSGCRVGVLICYDNNLIENVRVNALRGIDLLIAPHQTGGCQTGDPHTMGVIDRRLWDERETDPETIEAELRGDKGRGWLMRWLPSRAHDNGVFLVFSNGVGVDGGEIRTGNAMILDPYGRILAETWRAADDMVVADLDPELRKNNSGTRWISARRPGLYDTLTQRTGVERDMQTARFDYEKK